MDKIRQQKLFKSMKKNFAKMLTRITIITTINMHMRYVKFKEKLCTLIQLCIELQNINFKAGIKSLSIPLLSMCPLRSRLNFRFE